MSEPALGAAPPSGASFPRRVVAWAITTSLVLGATAFASDGMLVLLRGRSSPRLALGAAAAAFGLSVIVGFAISPLAALVEAACAKVARSGRVGRLAWPIPLAVIALAHAAIATDSFHRAQQGTNILVVLGFPAGVVTAAVLATWRFRKAAVLFALALALAALAANVVERSEERVRHDLLSILATCFVLAAATSLRARARVAGSRALLASSAGVLAVAVSTLVLVDHVAPGWRVRSEAWARFGPSLARVGRAVVDLDGDGFSPLFWGGDCDDLDSNRNPRAHEQGDGIDHNCNGVTPPSRPTDAELGLAPGAGEPALGPGEIDRVVLVTIDCLRADAVRPDVMPRLSAFATRGLTMTRAYSVGARTVVSLGFAQRPNGEDDPPVAVGLGAHGVDSTVIFSFGLDRRADVFLKGFANAHVAELEQRFQAAKVSDLGLEHLANERGRQYLWLHYYDAHEPIEVDADPSSPPVGLPPRYVAALGVIDRELARVLDAIDEGGRLARTLVIVTADHGEAFGAHGIPYHALSAYEPLIHVPLVVVAPGLAPGRYDGLVTHRDLPPTLLGAFGLDAEARAVERFGRSWLRLRAAREAPLHEFVVSYSWVAKLGEKHLSPMAAIVEPRRKLMETFGNTLIELYDPLADPAEEDDLAPAERATVARLRHTLAIYRDVDGFL